MWSDSYKEYVKSLVESNRGEYPYYVAHTCTYWGYDSFADMPSFKVYFSKDPITATDIYTYILSDNSMVYSVIGSNASRNYSDQRVTTSSYSGTLVINDYEFIYSNAEYITRSIQPDILATTNVTQSHFDGVSLIILAVLLGTIVARLVRR